MNELDFDKIFTPEEYLAGLADYRIVSDLYQAYMINLKTGAAVDVKEVYGSVLSLLSRPLGSTDPTGDILLLLNHLRNQQGEK